MNKASTVNSAIAFDRKFAESEQKSALRNKKLACPLRPEEALQMLVDGNKKYILENKPCFEVGEFEDDQNPSEQCPIAVVVCCSDSRVPPDLVFWQPLGRLFVTRVAGNTVDAAALGSIAYAVTTFKTPLIVVLGHERCGAVKAAVDFVKTAEAYDEILAGIIQPILPAAIAAMKAKPCDDPYEASMLANVARTVDALGTRFSALLEDGGSGTLRIVGARYDLNDGTVAFLESGGSSPASV